MRRGHPGRLVGGGTLVALLMLVVACAQAPSPPPPRAPALRIGITPNVPPIAFARQGELVGLEVDLARKLAAELGRVPEFVELPWDQQISALRRGTTDVIMSGMTVTVPRLVQVAFAEPYLRSGLAAMMRRSDAHRYDSLDSIEHSPAHIGAVSGTTGATFVRNRLAENQVGLYPTVRAAVDELLQRHIDVFIHDIPMIVWFVSRNEGELTLLRKRLNEEHLAWAFRQEDTALRQAADRALARWKQDGTLTTVIDRWLPYWSRIE